jgi:hypothetical protein
VLLFANPQENCRDLGQSLVCNIPHANISVEQYMLQMDKSFGVIARRCSSIGIVEIPCTSLLKERKPKVCPPRKDHRIRIVEVVAQLSWETDGVLQFFGQCCYVLRDTQTFEFGF